MEISLYIWMIIFVLLTFLVTYFYMKRELNREIFKKEKVILELHELQQQQNFFIQKMIHEMNTPLNSIELNLGALAKECNIKNLEMIKGSARILATIYDDIVFVARKERLCYPVEWIDLSDFIADRILYFHSISLVKEIIIELDTGEEYQILISRTELQRLIDNNISNAIKYTMEVGKVITISLQEYDEGIQLSFKDQGIGMNKEEKDKIFEVYYRESNNQKGLGLGMSIINDICMDHHIQIDVKTMKGLGSTFSYQIPKEIIRQTETKQ
jgi:signal transduction histidine kinase